MLTKPLVDRRFPRRSCIAFARHYGEGRYGKNVEGGGALPRVQFADLLAVVLAEKLAKVDMLFEGLRRGSGVMRSVYFKTAPVPSEAEMEGGADEQ